MQLMAEEQGLEVSLDGFNKCMEQQRERSRVTSPSSSFFILLLVLLLYFFKRKRKVQIIRYLSTIY